MQGFKDLIKKRPKKEEKLLEACSPGEYDMRPTLYIRDEQLPGVLEGCELGKKYLVEVEMVSKETRESERAGQEGKRLVSGDFRVVAFNPEPTSEKTEENS